MSLWDHIANDLSSALADGSGPAYAVTVTVPGVAAVACNVMAEERPQAVIPGEGGNTASTRLLAVTLSRQDVAALPRQTTIVFADGVFAGTWRVEYIETRTTSAWVAVCMLEKTLGVHGAGVRS